MLQDELSNIPLAEKTEEASAIEEPQTIDDETAEIISENVVQPNKIPSEIHPQLNNSLTYFNAKPTIKESEESSSSSTSDSESSSVTQEEDINERQVEKPQEAENDQIQEEKEVPKEYSEEEENKSIDDNCQKEIVNQLIDSNLPKEITKLEYSALSNIQAKPLIMQDEESLSESAKSSSSSTSISEQEKEEHVDQREKQDVNNDAQTIE